MGGNVSRPRSEAFFGARQMGMPEKVQDSPAFWSENLGKVAELNAAQMAPMTRKGRLPWAALFAGVSKDFHVDLSTMEALAFAALDRFT